MKTFISMALWMVSAMFYLGAFLLLVRGELAAMILSVAFAWGAGALGRGLLSLGK